MQKRTTSSNARQIHCSISEASPAACVMGDLLTVPDSAHAAPLHPRLPFFHSVPSVESKDNPRWIVLSNEPSTFRAPSSCTDGHTCSESGHFAWHGSQRIIGMSQITMCDLSILSQLRSYTHLNMPRFNVDLARNLLFDSDGYWLLFRPNVLHFPRNAAQIILVDLDELIKITR